MQCMGNFPSNWPCFVPRYEVTEVPDGKFGIKENNTWNGMIGMVERKVREIF